MPGKKKDDGTDNVPEGREYIVHLLTQLAVVAITLLLLDVMQRSVLGGGSFVFNMKAIATARSTAILLNGVHAGALLFVGAVMTRTLNVLADKQHKYVLTTFMPIFWPHGSDFFLPLMVLTIAAHAAQRNAACAILVGAIIPYTRFVMGEDIAQLVSGEGDVLATVRSFCTKHHARTVLSLAAAVLAINAS